MYAVVSLICFRNTHYHLTLKHMMNTHAYDKGTFCILPSYDLFGMVRYRRHCLRSPGYSKTTRTGAYMQERLCTSGTLQWTDPMGLHIASHQTRSDLPAAP